MVYFLFLILFGHFFGAMVVYLNHRFIFHGRMRRWPILKRMALLHALHHKHAYDNVDRYIFVPIWGKVAILVTILLISLLSPAFAVGIASFCYLYMYRHWAIHNTDSSSKFYHHHNLHHRKYPNKNFSGIYPFIDRLFGTAKEE